MPPVLEKLPCTYDLLRGNLRVDGALFLECFCGQAAITLACILINVPCICPWDVIYGNQFNVLTCGHVLLELILAHRIVAQHFAVPCQSLTWARWPQLRDALHPEGLQSLSHWQQSLVDQGNALAAFTAECCELLHSVGGYFSVENPELSWLWLLPYMLMLANLEGVQFIRVLFKDFAVPYLKPTLILHNMPTLHNINLEGAPWLGETLRLRGKMWWDGKLQFCTHVAQPYPPVLGVAYAKRLKEALHLRATALEGGFPCPMAQQRHSVVPSLSLQQAAWMTESPSGAWTYADQPAKVAMEEVPMGMGARKALTPLEHVEWSKSVCHPSASPPANATLDLREALRYESDTDPEEIDAERERLLYRFIMMTKDMQKNQKRWAAEAAPSIQPLVQKIHGPFFRQVLSEATGSEETFELLIEHCQHGFPFVGDLPPCEGASAPGLPKSMPELHLTADELRQERSSMNEQVIRQVKELPFCEDIQPAVLADAKQGFMSLPTPLTQQISEQTNLTRRIPVREERQSGWRTRIVDHETESFINEATRPQDRVQHDGLDLLTFMLTSLLALSIQPLMWKCDVSSAFRRVPICSHQLDLAWVVWASEGQLWAAQHLGMPFGTVSAVYAWHRVGHALLLIILKLFLAPLGRYVDDFFGTSRSGVQLCGGTCLTVMAALIGFPMDDAKSASQTIYMVVLGASVNLDWAKKLVTMHVDDVKAEKWKECLLTILECGICSAELSAKMGGRLSFAVSVAANRVGRAFLKPFYAQQHAPLKGNAVGCWLAWACSWFVHYLTHRPRAIRRGISPRPLLVTWHDAAGASRWVAAVVRFESGYLWTRTRTPQHVWEQLTERSDSQIGFQELLGVVLILGTFAPLVAGRLWVGFGDNDGITHALARGGGHNPESNMIIGKIWLHLASLDTDLHAARVESAANIADGPSRDSFDLLQVIGARFVEPKLPEWIHDIWHCKD